MQCSGGTMPHAPLEFKFEFNKFVKKCASWTETIKPYLDVSKMAPDRFFPANCHQEAPMPTGRSHAFQELLPYGLPVTRFKQTWMKLNIGWCSHCIHVSMYSLLAFLSETTKTQTSIHLTRGVLTVLIKKGPCKVGLIWILDAVATSGPRTHRRPVANLTLAWSSYWVLIYLPTWRPKDRTKTVLKAKNW